MNKQIIDIFNQTQEKLKGSISVLNIINGSLDLLVNKYNCCLDLGEKAIGYRELYNDIIKKYNRILTSAKKLTTHSVSLSNEIISLHKFAVILFNDLLAFDRKITYRTSEMSQMKDIEERKKQVSLYNLPSVPKHNPTMKGGKKKHRKTKRKNTRKRRHTIKRKGKR